MGTTRLKLDRCPCCGTPLDAASSSSGLQPIPGDISLCSNCCQIVQFDEHMRLQPADFREFPEELKTIVVAMIVRFKLQRILAGE
jgi:hypothetical protein